MTIMFSGYKIIFSKLLKIISKKIKIRVYQQTPEITMQITLLFSFASCCIDL